MVARSNIEEADVLGVGLDEQAARLDLIAHQHREEAVRRGRVFDVDANQQPARRIHRRLPQLRVVHLAETLETVELDSFLREVERQMPQLLVRLRELVPIPRHRLDGLVYVARGLRLELDEAVRDHEVRRRRIEVGAQARQPAVVLDEHLREARPLRRRELHLRAVARRDVERGNPLACQQFLELRVLLEVELLVAQLDPVERRDGDVHVAALDQLRHLPVQERQDQRTDVRTVHVGVGHDDHAVVSELRDVELVAEAGAQRRDHRLDLVVRENLVDPVLLAVDDLAAERQNRLVRPVAAHLRRAAGGVTLDDEELGGLRILDRAVGELARQRRRLKRALSPRQLTRLARREPRAHRGDTLVDDLPRIGRIFLEELRDLLIDNLLDDAAHPRVAELRLRLPFELRVLQLHGDYAGETFADVLSIERLVLLQQSLVAGVAVQRRGQCTLEAGQMRTALVRVDVVGEGEDGLLVRRVPLHRHLDLALLVVALEVDDVLVDRVLRLVRVGDEVADAALVVERDRVATGALVREDDRQALREERHLAQALFQRVGGELELLEDLGVRKERDRRARLLRDACRLHLADGNAARELLAVDLSVALNFGDEPFRQRVDDRDTDAVQPGRDLVTALAELAAGMKLCQDDREGGQALVLHDVDRDAGAPVPDRDRIVGVKGHLDTIVSARHCLVDGIVDHLVNEVVEAPRTGRADVHARPFPDRVEPLKDRDVLRGVVCFSHREKALQMPTLRAVSSVSERAAGTGSCEARGGGPRHQIPELFVGDFRSQLHARLDLLGGGHRDVRFHRVAFGRLRFRQRSGRETQSRRRERTETLADVVRELLELESPRGRARVHVQRSVTCDARGPSVACDLLADGSRPHFRDPPDLGLRAEARQLAVNDVTERIQAPPPRSVPALRVGLSAAWR